MRLGAVQKQRVLAARPGATLTRRPPHWVVTWHADSDPHVCPDTKVPVAQRWRAQAVARIDENGDPWFWPEEHARTRDEAIRMVLGGLAE